MAIKYMPQMGAILICDFAGLQEPEMTKRRPVVVISPKIKDRWGLCSEVPLSTTPPRQVKEYHHQLQTVPPLPQPYNSEWHWVKADMIYTLSFNRLSMPSDGKDANGKRTYDDRVISAEDLLAIQQCVLKGLGIKA